MRFLAQYVHSGLCVIKRHPTKQQYTSLIFLVREILEALINLIYFWNSTKIGESTLLSAKVLCMMNTTENEVTIGFHL